MERYQLPQTTESITRERIDNTINLATPEDAIKYMPSVQVRSRYIGDTNAPVGMRTSGTVCQRTQPDLCGWHSAVFLARQQQYQHRFTALEYCVSREKSNASM